jgi:hypothetical protein
LLAHCALSVRQDDRHPLQKARAGWVGFWGSPTQDFAAGFCQAPVMASEGVRWTLKTLSSVGSQRRVDSAICQS